MHLLLSSSFKSANREQGNALRANEPNLICLESGLFRLGLESGGRLADGLRLERGRGRRRGGGGGGAGGGVFEVVGGQGVAAPPGSDQAQGGERLVELRHVRQDGEAVRDLGLHHVLRVEESGDAQVLLRDAKGKSIVFQDVLRLQVLYIAER